MDIEDIKVSDEEIQEEAEAQKQLVEDEIREDVVADLGIEDNDANKALIDKLVERETDHRTKLSKAVGQKIKYREQLGGKKPAPTDKSKKTEQVDPAKLVEEKFMQRDLDDMDHSDKVKEQIKKIAVMNDISIRKAEQDPYIQHLIAEEARQKSVDDAAKGGKKRTVSGVTIDVSKPLDPKDFDLSTPEGRKEWADAKQAKRDALKS